LSDTSLSTLTFCTALGCGLIAGVFFAFSAFVMRALRALPPAQGIAAMQSINVVAVTPVFMTALFGTAAACLVLAGSALFARVPGAMYLVAGGVVYVAGVIVVTIVCNVPRNNALAAVQATSAEGAHRWTAYVAGWTAWNHVRAAAALVAAALLTIGFAITQ
jgi:uncharacterized membrane protein